MTSPRPGTSPKGRPTPKRSDKERRTGPVAPPPQTRKEAAKRLREQQAAGRKDLRKGYAAGDESSMLVRDRGPVRSLVRDVVDSRRNIAVIVLPLALTVVVGQVFADPRLLGILSRVLLVGLVVTLSDLVVLALRVRKVLAARPGEPETGRRTARHIGYALLRSTAIRRFRMPPPKVAVGDVVVPR